MQSARFPHYALRRLALCAAAVLCGCLMGPDERQSRGSVIENEVVGILYVGDAPAVGAHVRLFAGNIGLIDAQKPPVAETLTDSLGRYRLTGLAIGMYSLLAQYDSLTYYRDSVFVSPSQKDPGDIGSGVKDTLVRTGTVKVQVRLEPPDPSALIVAEILGTDLAAQADSSGNIMLAGVPSGTVRIRIRSDRTDYLVQILPIVIKPGSTATLGVLNLPRLAYTIGWNM